jgi:transposase-like protein
MSGDQIEGRRRRRSRAEVEQLVAQYEGSGLRRQEFCERHGLSLSTLNRHRKGRRRRAEPVTAERLVAVEISEAKQSSRGKHGSELLVLLASGRKIEVRDGFDTKLLQQVVRVLEQI